MLGQLGIDADQWVNRASAEKPEGGFYRAVRSEAALLDKAAAISQRWLRGLGIARSPTERTRQPFSAPWASGGVGSSYRRAASRLNGTVLSDRGGVLMPEISGSSFSWNLGGVSRPEFTGCPRLCDFWVSSIFVRLSPLQAMCVQALMLRLLAAHPNDSGISRLDSYSFLGGIPRFCGVVFSLDLA